MSRDDAAFVLAVYRDLESLETACLDWWFADSALPPDPQLVSENIRRVLAAEAQLLRHDLLRLDELAGRVLHSNPGEWGIRFREAVVGKIGEDAAALHGRVQVRRQQLHTLADLVHGAHLSVPDATFAALPPQRDCGRGKPPLESSDPLRCQIYERICREHVPRQQYADTLERLKLDKDFVQQVQEAGLTLNSRLMERSLAWGRRRGAQEQNR